MRSRAVSLRDSSDKPAVFVVNKWDLAKDRIPTGKWAEYLRKTFPMLDHVPIAFVTASHRVLSPSPTLVFIETD